MTLILGYITEFIGNNKWLVVLGLLTLLVTSIGGVIVDCVAYMQPKTTVIRVTQKEVRTTDRTVTERREIVRPDGTRELLETIRADIQALSSENSSDSAVSEPVLSGKGKLTWLPGVSYAPMQKTVGLVLGAEYGIFQLSLKHDLMTFQADNWSFNNSFAPLLIGTIRYQLPK